MLDRMLGHSCRRLQSLGDFVEHPDLADDSFILAARALHYCPRLVLPRPLLPLLLDSAAAGLLVQHRCACNRSWECSLPALCLRLAVHAAPWVAHCLTR